MEQNSITTLKGSNYKLIIAIGLNGRIMVRGVRLQRILARLNASSSSNALIILVRVSSIITRMYILNRSSTTTLTQLPSGRNAQT